MSSVSFTRPIPGGVEIAVKAVPGASRDLIAGVLGDALKVKVAAPPEGGKANVAIRALLAEALGVPERNVELVAGHTSPRKRFAIRGVTESAAAARLS